MDYFLFAVAGGLNTVDFVALSLFDFRLQLVTYGATRAEALSKMEDALDNYVIRGVQTFFLLYCKF